MLEKKYWDYHSILDQPAAVVSASRLPLWHFTNLTEKGEEVRVSHLFGKAQLEKRLPLRRKR